jgi:DNA-binding IclR family transcriptional regulator
MVAFDNRYTKRYFLGIRLHSLVDLAHYSTQRSRLCAFLADVVDETGGAAYIYAPLLNDIIALERTEAPRGLIVEIGRRLPMGIGAARIALLAALPAERASELIDANANRYREYSGLSATEVWASVEEARASGYGITRQQVARNFIGIGNGHPQRPRRTSGRDHGREHDPAHAAGP